MKSVLQDWVQELGLRHQGCLIAAIRGCDTAPKDDPSKLLCRSFRNMILNAFVGDAKKCTTFIEAVDDSVLVERFDAFRKNRDHYPHHYVMHLVHAMEIIGYKHPDAQQRRLWNIFYITMCRGMHINPESEQQLDERLNADEHTFGNRDKNMIAEAGEEVHKAMTVRDYNKTFAAYETLLNLETDVTRRGAVAELLGEFVNASVRRKTDMEGT